MPTITLTSKGQVTLPAELRRRMRLEAGSQLDLTEQSDGSWLLRAVTGDIRAIKGLVRRPARPVTVEEMDDAIAEAAAARSGSVPR